MRSQGLNIVATSFDGKSHGRIVRDDEARPTTATELQRQMWTNASDISREEIITFLESHQGGVKRLELICLFRIEELRQVTAKHNIKHKM